MECFARTTKFLKAFWHFLDLWSFKKKFTQISCKIKKNQFLNKPVARQITFFLRMWIDLETLSYNEITF